MYKQDQHTFGKNSFATRTENFNNNGSSWKNNNTSVPNVDYINQLEPPPPPPPSENVEKSKTKLEQAKEILKKFSENHLSNFKVLKDRLKGLGYNLNVVEITPIKLEPEPELFTMFDDDSGKRNNWNNKRSYDNNDSSDYKKPRYNNYDRERGNGGERRGRGGRCRGRGRGDYNNSYSRNDRNNNNNDVSLFSADASSGWSDDESKSTKSDSKLSNYTTKLSVASTGDDWDEPISDTNNNSQDQQKTVIQKTPAVPKIEDDWDC